MEETMQRIAVVTGGTTGIGGGVVRALEAAGHRTVIFDIDEAAISALDKPQQGFVVDVMKEAEVNAAFERVIEVFGRVDILVNAVGGSIHERQIEGIENTHWDQIMDLNLKSAFHCTRAVTPHMKRQQWGRIVNISAVAGRTFTHFGGVDFTAAKAGLIGLTRQCAFELAKDGVTVNAVAPGLTLSERVAEYWELKSEEERERLLTHIPIGRPSTVEEQAAPITFLCSEQAAYICGAVLDVNGAMFTP